jgi:membrane protease YdiL (CAAX protease family)
MEWWTYDRENSIRFDGIARRFPGETMVATTVTQRDQPNAIAPAWHTVVVLLVLFTFSALSARAQSLSPIDPSHGRLVSYATVLALEWFLTAFIWLGIRPRRMRLRELIGGSWPSLWAVLRDLGVAILFLIAANVVLTALGYLLRATPSASMRSIFPNGPTEIVVYLFLALTAGICEEIIFRGYLQNQFAALTKSRAAGLLLQGVAFAAAHGYQSRQFIFIIAVYGCLFGLLAYWRRSLRPGMTAHFLNDAIGGLVTRHFLK